MRPLRFARSLATLAALLANPSCERAASPQATGLAAAQSAAPGPTTEVQTASQGRGVIEVKTVDVHGDAPVFFLRSTHPTSKVIVFLHGACCHGLGYVQAFQQAAAERASVLALQGDVRCAGPFRSWSFDIEKQNARINTALLALGERITQEVLVIGYSQGATLAEMLVARYPTRYTRAILIGAPRAPSLGRLRALRGAVMMSGELDAKQKMKDGAHALSLAGVPATYIEIPGARHGQMGDGERLMGEAFRWLEANAGWGDGG